MKVILPVAGYATRLYPLTENFPKALLKIGNKPMLEHILDKLNPIKEIDEIFVVTNNKFYTQFSKWANEYKSEKIITVVNDGTMSNEDRLGAVGDVNFAIDKGNIDGDVIVIAGDNLFGLDMQKFVNFSKEKDSSVFAAYDLKNPSLLAKKFGTVEVDDNCKVIGFEEKPEHPKTALAATMIYLILQRDLYQINNCLQEKNPDNWGEFARYLIEKSGMHCLHFDEYWYDIGGLEQYKEVQDKF